MKTSYALPLIAAILMALPLRAAPIVPGTGIKIESLSDDFEDPDWSFDYATNISSNKLWRGSYRGAPTSLQVVPTPSGGPSGSTQTLQVRTDDTVTEPEQADLVSASYLTRIGRRLTRADLPNFVMHAYLSASSEWPEGRYTFQMRLETDTQAGRTYPSISFYRFGNTAHLNARTWDPSTWSTTLGNNLPARWVTIGHSFDIDGWHSMYYRTGVGPLTAADHLHTQTQYADTQTDWLGYHFVSLQKNEGGPLTPDHRMDNYFVYAAGWAHTPSPADGSSDAMPDATLGWTAGQSATAHAVYFGTSPTLGAGDFQGSQSGTTFDPGGLALNTTYYWRIDETNPAGVATGLVWRFSTPTVYAQSPQPEDEAVDVALDAGLSWTAHPLATAQAVYLGRESDLGPDDFQGEQTGTTFVPGPLEWGTTYYWRIDAVGSGGTTQGTAWSFQTLPDTPPRVVALSIVDGQVKIFYTGNEVGAEIPYVMLRSTNLASGAWSVVDPQVPRTANPETSLLWEDPTPPEGAGFYKLRTTP